MPTYTPDDLARAFGALSRYARKLLPTTVLGVSHDDLAAGVLLDYHWLRGDHDHTGAVAICCARLRQDAQHLWAKRDHRQESPEGDSRALVDAEAPEYVRELFTKASYDRLAATLTASELAAVSLVIERDTTRTEAARRLGVTESAVRARLASAYRKLRLTPRSAWV